MKKILILFYLFISAHAFAQVSLNGTENNMYVVTLGPDHLIASNAAYNSWSELNYHNRQNYSLGGNFDFSAISRYYDIGLHTGVGNPYVLASIYAGRRLTSIKSSISSFLNFQVGGFFAKSDDAPVGYVPTPDQAGKSLFLAYSSVYMGLSSRNYINKLHFTSGKGKNRASYNSGFFFDLNDSPWAGEWKYGYDKGSGKYEHFIGNKADGVPNLNQAFMDAGIFMTIGN